MRSRHASLPLGILFSLLAPGFLQAGMTSYELTDVAKMRLDAISFFLVLYLCISWAFKVIWNYVARDFPKMPQLNYLRALGIMVVSGMLVYVVLTMIAGARELMTPGAWRKDGSAYYLREPEQMAKPWLESARQQSLERLRTALWEYARRHQGKFPPHIEADDFQRELWLGVDPARTPYGYYPGQRPDVGNTIIAFEPYLYGTQRYVLLSTGEIVKMAATDLSERATKQLEEALKP